MNTFSTNIFTSEPGNYKLNESRLHNTINYPWNPTTILQYAGGSILKENITDIESEIKNITRPLSNIPQQQYNPDNVNKKQEIIHYKDGGFNQQDTRLNNNSFELKGVGINRWEPLFFDPQKNSIEPFLRIGNNTILEVLDKHINECNYNNKVNQ